MEEEGKFKFYDGTEGVVLVEERRTRDVSKVSPKNFVKIFNWVTGEVYDKELKQMVTDNRNQARYASEKAVEKWPTHLMEFVRVNETF